MHREVRSIEANDILTWPHWRPAGVAQERQWFTITISPGGAGGDLFQVCVASVAWLRQQRVGKCVGLSVEQFDPEVVRQAIHNFVATVEADSWREVAAALAPIMTWEFAGISKGVQ